ncbi:MAG TPA: hypothetical protein VEC99_04080 [Clostridia bacterium]|nr:hypothetical protein [Clostridia bacterium]
MLAKEPEGFSGAFRRMGYVVLLPLLRLPYRTVLKDLPQALTDAGVSPGDAAQISLSRLVIFALCSRPEFWASLAVEWLLQGFPVNSDIFMAGEEMLQSKRGMQRVRQSLAHILGQWKKSQRYSPGPGSSTSACTGVYLISEPLLAYLRNRFGGVTSAACQALTPRPGYRLEGSVKLSLFPQDDSTYGYAILHTLCRAFAQASESRAGAADAVLQLISFYYPLFTSGGFRFDDSGGTARPIGPVLAPERCRYLLEYWLSVETHVLEKQLDKYPIFFNWDERPHEKFHSARQLLGLLGRHAAFLGQAVGRDCFYFSYDSNSL